MTRVDFSLLLALFMRLQYSYQLETVQFAGKSGDYAWCLLLGLAGMSVGNAAWFQMASLWECLSMYIVYIWSQYNRAVTVSFMFGFRFPAVYLPLVLLAMEFVTSGGMGNLWGSLMGIILGHLYYFMAELYPNQRVKAFLRAPTSIARWFAPAPMAPGSTRTFTGFTMHAPGTAADEKNTGFKAFSGKSSKIGG